jgi:hypothetical protein
MEEVVLGIDGLGINANDFKTLVLQQEKETVTIMFVKVAVEHQGTFRGLIAHLEDMGKNVRVYTPVIRTREIIARLGYAPEEKDSPFWSKVGRTPNANEMEYGYDKGAYRWM